MTDREILRRQLLRDEGLKLEPYRCTAGALTIGCGFNVTARGWAPLEKIIGRRVNKNAPAITHDEALQVLDADIDATEREIARRWPWTEALAPARQRALCNMAFNMGVSGLAGFVKMLAALEAGEHEQAAIHALDSQWRKDVGPKRSARIAIALRTGLDAA